jgi:hypothetical protein
MKILSLIPVLSSVLFLVSDVPGIPPGASSLMQDGAMVILSGLLWYLFARTFPAHSRDMKEQTKTFLEFLRWEREHAERTKGD